MKLFLCGGQAENKPGIKLVTAFADAVLRSESKKLLYLPMAMPEGIYNSINYTYDAMFNAVRKVFGFYGVDNVDMWTNVNNKTIEDLGQYGGVYIGGGNTFSLLDKFRKAGFDIVLAKYIDGNNAVYGCSAGAVILGRDIGTAYFGSDADQNAPGLGDLKALNKVYGYTITCHYTERDDANITKYAETNNFEVISLRENTGLRVNSRGIEVVGNNQNDRAYLFNSLGKNVLGVGSLLRTRR